MRYALLAFLLGLVALAWLLFRPTYEYAVDRQSVKLDYRSYYDDDRDRRFDFYTVIYTKEDCSKPFTNYSAFTIYVTHLAFPFSKEGEEYASSIEIIFPDKDRHAVEVLKDSLRLTHAAGSGEVLSPAGADQLREAPYSMTFTRRYLKREVPEKIVEHISLELKVDGQVVKIEKAYPLSKAPHYSFWTKLMGV